jgi:hypothetical protein
MKCVVYKWSSILNDEDEMFVIPVALITTGSDAQNSKEEPCFVLYASVRSHLIGQVIWFVGSRLKPLPL